MRRGVDLVRNMRSLDLTEVEVAVPVSFVYKNDQWQIEAPGCYLDRKLGLCSIFLPGRVRLLESLQGREVRSRERCPTQRS